MLLKNRDFFHTPRILNAVVEGDRVWISHRCSVWKSRMIGVPCAGESMKVCYAASIQYRNVSDRQTGKNVY